MSLLYRLAGFWSLYGTEINGGGSSGFQGTDAPTLPAEWEGAELMFMPLGQKVIKTNGGQVRN
jgi:hypothetical protein